MIKVTQISETFWHLTTNKGQEIQVAQYASTRVSVYIKRRGQGSATFMLSLGRHFHGHDALSQAIAAYRSADIRDALIALQDEQIDAGIDAEADRCSSHIEIGGRA